MADEEQGFDLASASSWDVATRYHDFKSRPGFAHLTKQLRQISAHAVLKRAEAVLGSVVHPVLQGSGTLDAIPKDATQVEIDLDETLQNSILGFRNADRSGFSTRDIYVEFSTPRKKPLILTVDTSLSMTGEKLAITAVALAVVLLQFPEDPLGIIAFENVARVLKRPDEVISVAELVERFLDVPAQGYTHLEDGMRGALKLMQKSGRRSGQGMPRNISTVLVTDGKYTAGRDPAYLAPRFPHLVVMKMGREKASLQLCRDLARLGRGSLRQVPELEALPAVMYGVVKDILRGRAQT
ncbi:MAG: VWA domain-containing protein [Bdellovibrionales bacterium]|nr:VWA domain-containing protein [Bdellovibrionales bacterium]